MRRKEEGEEGKEGKEKQKEGKGCKRKEGGMLGREVRRG